MANFCMRREEFVPCYVHGFFKLYLKLSGSRVQDFKEIWLAELCKCLKLVVNSIAFLFLGYVQMWYNICVVLLAPCKQRLFFCYQVRWKSSCSHSLQNRHHFVAFFRRAKSGCEAWDMHNMPLSIMRVSCFTQSSCLPSLAQKMWKHNAFPASYCSHGRLVVPILYYKILLC